MSLAAANIISDVTDPGKASLLASFNALTPASNGLSFRGDSEPLTYWPVMPSTDPSRYFDSAASMIDATMLQLGIGDPDQPATGGTWNGSYSSDTSGLASLAYNISATALAIALNANTAITADGGVSVTQASPFAWRVVWTVVGVRSNLIEGNPAGLTPDSSVFVYRDQVGSSTMQEVQIIEIVQRPLVFVTSWTLSPAAGESVVTLSNGSGSQPASFSITLSPAPYGGSFQVTTSDGVAVVAWNSSQQAFAAALPGTGGATWSCQQLSPVQWVITRSATGAQTCTVDVTNLLVYQGFTGTLGFNAPALITRFLSLSTPTFTTTLEIRYVDGTSPVQVLYSGSITISKDILSSAAIAPTVWNQYYLTMAQSDARYPRAFLSGNLSTTAQFTDVDITAMGLTDAPTHVDGTTICPANNSDQITITGAFVTSATSIRVFHSSPAPATGYLASLLIL